MAFERKKIDHLLRMIRSIREPLTTKQKCLVFAIIWGISLIVSSKIFTGGNQSFLYRQLPYVMDNHREFYLWNIARKGNTGECLVICLRSNTACNIDHAARRRYITIDWSTGRRLGNSLFGLATLLGIGTKYGMAVVLPDDLVPFIFDNFVLNDDIIHVIRSPRPKYFRPVAEDEFISGYINILFEKASDNIILFENSDLGRYHLRRYFMNIETDLKKGLLFKGHLIETAKQTLRKLIVMKKGIVFYWTCVKIGIHVRRGDYDTEDRQEKGLKLPGSDYFSRAIDYFRASHTRVIFVVCSEDPTWVRENINDPDMVISSETEGRLDLALLSLCDHVVMSFGTYGWWGGWFSGGTLVYPKNTSWVKRGEEDMPQPSVAL